MSFEPSLVPELLVGDVGRSVEFWCGICGFVVAYERPEEKFAYVVRGSAQVMLEEEGVGRNWVAGAMERPLGRGVNFQVGVADLEPILAALGRAGYPLFMEPEAKWYRVGAEEEVGVRQFLVADPDGYLIRFQSSLGRRRVYPSDQAETD